MYSKAFKSLQCVVRVRQRLCRQADIIGKTFNIHNFNKQRLLLSETAKNSHEHVEQNQSDYRRTKKPLCIKLATSIALQILNPLNIPLTTTKGSDTSEKGSEWWRLMNYALHLNGEAIQDTQGYLIEARRKLSKPI